MLLCYNYQNGTTDEEEDIIFVMEPRLVSISTINLPKKNLVYRNHKVFPHIYTKFQNYSTKQSSLELISIKRETINIYEPKVALKDKIYLETYYRH